MFVCTNCIGVSSPKVEPRERLLVQLAEVFPEIDLDELGCIVDEHINDDNEDCFETLIDAVMVRHLAFIEDWEDEDIEAGSWQAKTQRRRRFRKLELDNEVEEAFSPNMSYAERVSANIASVRSRPFFYVPFTTLPPLSRHDLDTDSIRSEISELLERRRELYAKASEAHQRGDMTGRYSSTYYADEATRLDSRIRGLKLDAAHRTFIRCNPDPYSRTLDLHWLTVDEAIPLMDAFLSHHFGESTSSAPVTIITGAGKHSEHLGGPRLRPAVWRRLGFSAYRFHYDGHALFTVYGRHSNNRQ
jgi:DNA-nicking Smr family endonuclease